MHNFSKWTLICLGERGNKRSALCMYTWGSYWKYDSPLGDHDDQKTGLIINCFCKMFVKIPLSKLLITQTLRPCNFTRISLLSQSVVITELMDSLFIFIYQQVALLSKPHILSTNSGMEIVTSSRPLWEPSFTFSLHSWKCFHHRNIGVSDGDWSRQLYVTFHKFKLGYSPTSQNFNTDNTLLIWGTVHQNIWGMQRRSWLRHCATSRKVVRSIPDGAIGFFHWHNPSGRTMALGST
jgi:hypothetical protein